MRKPTYSSKRSRSSTSWWKHARRLGKRSVNKSERKGLKVILVKQSDNI